MAAAAILDFIIVRFLRHGWEDYHQIRYAGAELHPLVENVAKIIIFAKTRRRRPPSWFWKNSHNFAQD